MEGLGTAASVISVIGLEGQVAQGCNYLQGIFSRAKSAPEDQRLLSTELAIIEQIVFSIPNEREYYDALDLFNGAIEKLRKLVEKYANVSSCRTYKQWSNKPTMAFDNDLIQKHASRLRTAKGHLLDVHNMSTTNSEQVHTRIRELGLSNNISALDLVRIGDKVEELGSSHTAAATIIGSINDKLEKIGVVSADTKEAIRELAGLLVRDED